LFIVSKKDGMKKKVNGQSLDKKEKKKREKEGCTNASWMPISHVLNGGDETSVVKKGDERCREVLGGWGNGKRARRVVQQI